MTQTRPYRYLMLIAALMLALTSFASAARMAPTAIDNPQMATFIAMGGTVDDLCGGDLSDHGAACPFCHVTADVRTVRPSGQTWQLVANAGPATLGALTLGDQGGRSAWSARGPPHAA